MKCLEETEYSIQDLIGLLEHSDIESRWRAATALSRIGHTAVDPLLKKMFDDDPNVRVLAIWALGKIGDCRAYEPVCRSAEEETGFVRLAAEGALSRLKK